MAIILNDEYYAVVFFFIFAFLICIVAFIPAAGGLVLAILHSVNLAKKNAKGAMITLQIYTILTLVCNILLTIVLIAVVVVIPFSLPEKVAISFGIFTFLACTIGFMVFHFIAIKKLKALI